MVLLGAAEKSLLAVAHISYLLTSLSLDGGNQAVITYESLKKPRGDFSAAPSTGVKIGINYQKRKS